MSTTNTNIETLSSPADKAKIALAVAAVIAGLVGFYMLANQPMIARVGSVLGGLIVGGVIAWFSQPGQQFFAFLKDSWSEAKRVVWPSRKETIQMTLAVFAFVLVMAIFLWVVDKTLEWVLYDLVLGWRK
jgi:preprotein translocase subunit SecE